MEGAFPTNLGTQPSSGLPGIQPETHRARAKRETRKERIATDSAHAKHAEKKWKKRRGPTAAPGAPASIWECQDKVELRS